MTLVTRHLGRHVRLAVVATALVLLAAACAGTGEATSGEAASADDREEALLEFAQCMRDEGIDDFPDPNVDGNGNFRVRGGGGDLDVDRETLTAAREACGDILEGIAQGFSEEDRSEFQDGLLEMAQCLRDQGLDVDDPDFSNDGPQGQGSGQGGPGGGGPFGGEFDTSDPEVQAALDTCREGVFDGEGPGGRFGARSPS